MLGMARASEYAGWWSGGAIKIDIPVATTVSQAAYQTPVFSWNGGIYGTSGGFQIPYNSGTPALNVSGYDSLSGFNAVKTTYIVTFQPKWDSGLTSASTNFRFSINPNSSTYDQGIQAYISSGALAINAGSINGSGGPGDSFTLPGAYTAYTAGWLTVVWCQSNSSSDYTAWTGTGTGTAYTRLAVYNTQTGALIKLHDQATSAGSFPNIGTMITGSGGTVSLAGSGYYVAWDFYGSQSTYQGVLAQSWISLGTMFDPVGIKATDSTWLTTRPNNTIGSGKAWLNYQWTDYELYAPALTYYLTDTSGGDLLTGSTNNRQAQIAPYASSGPTEFAYSYSTTNIPKDTS